MVAATAAEQAESQHATGDQRPDGDLAAAPNRWHEVPGGRLALASVLVVAAAAFWDVHLTGRIGDRTGITLVAVSIIAALLTAPGDRSIPVITPPLAFLVAVLTAGQLTVYHTAAWRSEQAVMVFEALGRNARWVGYATGLAAGIVIARIAVELAARRRAGGGAASLTNPRQVPQLR